MAIPAIVVAVVAVVVALYEARIYREHQEISVWPYLTQANSTFKNSPDSEDLDGFRKIVLNRGIGPALVRSFQVRPENS